MGPVELVLLVIALWALSLARRATRRLDRRDRAVDALERRIAALEGRPDVEQVADRSHPYPAHPAARDEPRPAPPEPSMSPASARPAAAPSPAALPPSVVTPQAAPATLPSAPHATRRPTFAPIDWENLIGVRLFSWTAGIALVFAAVFFLRWSIDHGWLVPEVRMAIGLATGVGLLAACEMRAARRYPVTANALDAAAIAILFATLFASHALWQLLPQLAAFALMTGVTALAAALSIRRESPFIALLGLCGGFATPALLSRGEDDPIGLFAYLLLLNAGLAWVAYRQRWPSLTAASIALTALYELGWAWRYLDASRLPLAMTIFSLFPLLHLTALTLGGGGRGARDGSRGEGQDRFGRAALASTAMPVAFALYTAAVPAYGEQYLLLFGFLFLVAAGLGVVGLVAARGPLYDVAGVATISAFAVWLAGSYDAGAWPGILGIVAAFVALHLALPRAARRRGRPFAQTTASHFAPALLFVPVVLLRIEPAAADPLLPFAVLFVLAAGVAWAAIDADDGGMHWTASFFVVAAAFVWSWTWLTDPRSSQAVAVFSSCAVFFSAVARIARSAGRRLDPPGFVRVLFDDHDAGDAVLAGLRDGRAFALAGPLLLFFVAWQPSVVALPWPLFAGIAVCSAAIAAAAWHEGAWVHAASLALAQLLLASPATGGGPASTLALVLLASLAVVAFGLAVVAFAPRRPAFASAAVAGALAAQLTGIAAATGDRALPQLLLFGDAAVLAAALLGLAAFSGRHGIAVAAACTTFVQASFLVGFRLTADNWLAPLLFVAALWTAFVAYPVVAVGERAARSIAPELSAVLSSALSFFLARECIEAGGYGGVIGLLPLVEAAALGRVLLASLRAGRREPARLALVAGAALAFVTVAIPLQLEHEWITIGWALETAALAWLWRRVPHDGLLVFTAALGAAVFARLTLNPAVLSYHPRAETPLWNWYLYTWLVPALSMLAAARLLRDSGATEVRRLRGLLAAGAGILLFLLLNIEIADFHSEGPTLTFNFSAGLAQDLSYTIGWALFAIATLAVAIRQDSRTTRVASLALLVVTVSKCFLHDLWRLGGLYRVGSFVGLAVSLALVALLMQRYVLGAQKENA